MVYETEFLIQIGEARLTSFTEKDFVWDGQTYIKKTIVRMGDLELDGQTYIDFTRAGAALIDREASGTRMFVKILRREEGTTTWNLYKEHLYIFSDVVNLGGGNYRVNFETPEMYLRKAQTKMWSDEYTRREYGERIDWFKNNSSVEEKVIHLTMKS